MGWRRTGRGRLHYISDSKKQWRHKGFFLNRDGDDEGINIKIKKKTEAANPLLMPSPSDRNLGPVRSTDDDKPDLSDEDNYQKIDRRHSRVLDNLLDTYDTVTSEDLEREKKIQEEEEKAYFQNVEDEDYIEKKRQEKLKKIEEERKKLLEEMEKELAFDDDELADMDIDISGVVEEEQDTLKKTDTEISKKSTKSKSKRSFMGRKKSSTGVQGEAPEQEEGFLGKVKSLFLSFRTG